MERKINWKYEIGQVIKDDKRDLTIIDRKIVKNKNGHNRKYYKYRCNKCGFDGGKHWNLRSKEFKEEFWIIEYSLLLYGCSCCSNLIVIKGINDISSTNPEMVIYFNHKEDAFIHTYRSTDKINFKCLECGCIKNMSIDKFYEYGFNCPQCSDGISYPEKFIYNLLKQLDVDFITQYSKSNSVWCMNYRYDFYFKKDNEEYIIETHGEQHYRKCTNFKLSLEEEQENDKNKYELAIDNDIKDENYIVIDCRKSKLDFIKNNIINSRLNEIFDLNEVDWVKIGQDSEKSLVKQVCDYWKIHNDINNEGLTTTDLSKYFNISSVTIREYLNKGCKINWCNYNPKEENIKNGKKTGKTVEIFKNGKSLGIFENYRELERQSEKLFGVKLDSRRISDVCNNKINSYKNYEFRQTDKRTFRNRNK